MEQINHVEDASIDLRTHKAVWAKTGRRRVFSKVFQKVRLWKLVREDQPVYIHRHRVVTLRLAVVSRKQGALVDILPKLPDAELAIMNLLWNAEKMTARQLREQLYPEDTRTNHGTIQKLLQRLEEKGFIRRDRTLFVHLFEARVSRSEYAGSQLEDLASRITDGSLAPFFTHLIGNDKVTEEDLEQLWALLNRNRSQQGGEGE